MVLPAVEAVAMHELSVMRNVVDIACEHAGGRPVRRLQLAVGRLSCVMPQALRFCFESIRQDTVLAQARLEIQEIEGLARCQACGSEFAMPLSGARCDCGHLEFELIRGNELKLVELELAEEN